MFTLPESDLEDILVAAEDAFASLRGQRVFMTGGTGFVGSWLTESFLWANKRLALGARLTILTRDPRRVAPRFARAEREGALTLAKGDIRTFDFDERPDSVINIATPRAADARDPIELVETIIGGTQNVLRFAAKSGTIPVLFSSSGAVYGRQPPELERIAEDYGGGPDQLDPRFAYHESKRLAELLHIAEARRSGIQPKIARLFAFVGPYLPLDAHFAIGNFLRDALGGGPILVTGDGTPIRSYMYASDLTIWLWRILHSGSPGRAYNVGSEVYETIEDVARAVATEAGLSQQTVSIAVRAPASIIRERYVPRTVRAQSELLLRERVPLASAIARTLRWYGQQEFRD